MNRDEPLQNPPRLLEMEHPYAEILARGNREFETPPEEIEAFCRTRARRSPNPLRGATVFAAVAIAAAALAALTVGVLTRPAAVSKSSVDVDTLSGVSSTFPSNRTRPDAIVTESSDIKLTTGERKLSDGSVVSLLPGASARLRDRGKATTLVLDRGKITLAVEPRAADAALEVSAGAYRFKVIGTRFSVSRDGDAVGLRVDEGRVAVFGEKGLVATVAAGGDWTNEEPTNDAGAVRRETVHAPEADSTPPKAGTQSAPDCRELARSGEPRKAEACYVERSSSTGLDAETALLEVARLRRDVLGDPEGSLSALESYKKRFPNGSLRLEADIAHVVLLMRLGRHDDALAESQRLLDSPNGRERAFELRMLRGSVYRKGLGNVALAAKEYAKAEALEGASSEATYLLGSCLEELGDSKGARAAFRRYLQNSPAGKRADEVRQRLGRPLP